MLDRKVIRQLEEEGGHKGLLAFIAKAGPENLDFEEGEPTKPESERVKTMIYVVTRYDDSILMCLCPMSEKISNRKSYVLLLCYKSEIKIADEETLRQIEMAPERCHPFPQIEHIEGEGIQKIFMDWRMVNQETPYSFPIYSSDQRLGSLFVSPKLYLATMKKLINEPDPFYGIISLADIIEND